ncbi:MAG: Calx-beta domain-containing protein [Chloroflexota bacterium]
MENKPGRQISRIGISTILILGTVLFLGWTMLFFVPAPEVQAQALPSLAFQATSVDVSEGAGQVVVTVRLSDPDNMHTQNVTVNYESFFGTATGADFTSVSGQLLFPPSTITRTITINITNDNIDEPTEFFYVRLIPNSAVNATIGTPSQIQINIIDDDEPPAATATPGGLIFLDAYEPNNSFAEAFSTGVGTTLCNATFWPAGDVDYYRFFAKGGSRYRVSTTDLRPGIDTVLTVYNSSGSQIAQNDDVGEVGTVRSQIEFTASSDGFYYAYIINKDPSDPTNKTYCFAVVEIALPTPTPSQTPMAGADACEFNSTIDFRCIIGKNVVYSLSFVPTMGSKQDTDIFWLWMKSGLYYTCDTQNLSPYADTNMIFLDQNGNDFQPNLGNDDKEPGDLGSRLSILAPYTGYLTIMVGPVNPPRYEESGLQTYELVCIEEVTTPTPMPSPTSTPAPFVPPANGSGTGGAVVPRTPTPDPSVPSPTPFDVSSIFLTLTPAPPPIVQINPLPTPTPSSGGQRLANVNVTLYYDSNNNYMPELTEGIMDVAVALYDNTTGQLLAFGYTNETGAIRFESISATGALRVSVPFLNYSQVVFGDESNILIRVSPQQLPGAIP